MYFNLLLILFFSLLWAITIVFFYFVKKQSYVYLIFFTIFYFYIFKVLDYTLLQFQSLLIVKHFTANLILNGLSVKESINFIPIVGLTSEDLKTSLLNILLFIPFGFGLPIISTFRIKKLIIIGTLFSTFIELVQFITGYLANITFRVADINDILFNTAGVVIGYILFVGFVRFNIYLTKTYKLTDNPFTQYIGKRPQAKNVLR